jgi:hypothetical protein
MPKRLANSLKAYCGRMLANSLKAYCGRMVIPAAVLRSAPADDWIVDANRNSVRAGIAFETTSVRVTLPLKLRRRFAAQRFDYLGQQSAASNHGVRPNSPPFSSGNEMGRSVRQAAHFERDQAVRPQPDRWFLVTNDGVI